MNRTTKALIALIVVLLTFGVTLLILHLQKHTKYLWLLLFCAITVGGSIFLGGED